ncbi:MAG: exodeoxyribonuclease III [Deltaproteobacteria bacterium]|nr:exodeoxyribonuclease III [Deltaproteobacteria bacterium]
MTFKFATFNANSVRTRLPVILEWMDNERPDVLFLQETKVQDRDFPSDPFSEAGYHAVFTGQKSYNGVAIISKNPLNDICLNLYDGIDEQSRFISAVTGDITLINAYAPQGFEVGSEKFEYKLRWLRDLLRHITANYDPDDFILLAGDFNVALQPIDVYAPERHKGQVGFHPDEQAVMQEFFKWGFIDIFRKHQPDGACFTFWDYRIPNAVKRGMGWRIDYVLTTAPLAEKSSNTWIDIKPRMLERPSDHTFVVAEFQDIVF